MTVITKCPVIPGRLLIQTVGEIMFIGYTVFLGVFLMNSIAIFIKRRNMLQPHITSFLECKAIASTSTLRILLAIGTSYTNYATLSSKSSRLDHYLHDDLSDECGNVTTATEV